MKKYLIAFTLIELLVVIAIIGILSGLIVVTMSGVVNKANIAKSQIYSNSLKSALMANLVSEWKMDQVNSPLTDQTPDSWSGGNNCTLKENGYGGACDSTHCPQLKTSGCASGNCFQFDGTNDYLDCGSSSNLNWGTGNFTIGLWTGPRTAITHWSWLVSKNAGSPGLEIALSDDIIRICFGVWFTDVVNDPGKWVLPSNAWHYIAVTRRDGTVYTYVNGSLYGTPVANSYDFSGIAGSPLLLGRGSAVDYLNGYMDDVRVYSTSIPTAQIKSNYYSGLNRMFSKKMISSEEYLAGLF
jgi:prepilin-type N-terminal cleavage/methylation domain-containing protein